MNKDKIILLILENIEITQSLIIALFLFFLHLKNKKKSLLLLALYFIFYTIASVIETGAYFNLIKNNLLPMSSALHFTAYSFFYAHIDCLLINSNKKKVSQIFTIGFIATALGITISLSSFLIQSPLIYLIGHFYSLFELVFLLYVTIILIIKIKNHNNLIKNQYSNTQNRKLQFLFYWIIVFMTYLIGFSIVNTASYLQEFTATIISLIWTLGLSYNALYHQLSENLFEKRDAKNSNSLQETTNEKSKRDDIITKTNFDLIEKIKQQIVTKELFLNPEFTISNLAELVGEHPKLVSQNINSATSQNFNTFINQFRVEYAKNMLLKAENQHLNIEGIGNLSGFKSNSAFYSAFKKQLNCTPLQFQKKHNS